MFSDLPDTITVADLKERLRLLPGNLPRPTRKADIIETIAGYLLASGARDAWNVLQQDERHAVAETVHRWSGLFNPERFAAMHGAVPASLEPDRLYYLSGPTEPKQDWLSLSSCARTRQRNCRPRWRASLTTLPSAARR